MHEESLNILSPASMDRFDAICFTSNGVVKANGELVMGAGVAKAFRDRFAGLAKMAGNAVSANGNVCQIVATMPLCAIVAFPTKNDWRHDSDLKLIVKSAEELVRLADEHGWRKVALPRPGCNNGGLDWSAVCAAIAPILDDRFVIVSRG